MPSLSLLRTKEHAALTSSVFGVSAAAVIVSWFGDRDPFTLGGAQLLLVEGGDRGVGVAGGRQRVRRRAG
jgi:hypothetical protein